MNHDDAFSSSTFDLPSQAKKPTLIDPATDLDFIIDQSKSSLGTLAATQDYQSRQASVEEAQSLTSPAVDNFLPSPNRLLVFGSLSLVGAIGIGGIASTLIPYNTTVKVQAIVEPMGNVELIKSDTGGVVDTIFVDEHDSLKSGQVIASFKNSTLQAQAAQIETQIAGTKERINQLEGQLAALERRRSAESKWLQQITPERAGLDNRSSQFESSKKSLIEHKKNLEARLQQGQNQLKQAQKQIENLTIQAPQEGRIYDLELRKLGQAIEPNETIAKIIPNGTELEITALVPDTHIKNVEVGFPTKLQLSKCKSLSFGSLPGKVGSVEAAQTVTEPTKPGSLSDDFHQITVETDVQTLQSGTRTCELLPGMKGELTIITKQEKLLDFFLRRLRLKSNI